MAGLLRALTGGAAGVDIRYSDLPEGGEIIFETDDLHLLTAIQRRFGAQLSERGANAGAE